jgi:hypothetical protein
VIKVDVKVKCDKHLVIEGVEVYSIYLRVVEKVVMMKVSCNFQRIWLSMYFIKRRRKVKLQLYVSPKIIPVASATGV